MFCTVKLGSITNAQRVLRALKKRGFNANIIRIQNPSKSDGCGYAVRINTNNPEAALHVIKQTGVIVLGVDRQ